MKIATFNINDVNKRLANLLAWLAEAQPDVVCLQGLKAEQGCFPEAALREAGYASAWHGQRSWNGVAILARGAMPIVRRTALPGDDADGQRATTRRRCPASSSLRSTCPTAILGPGRNSTTS